MSSSAVLPPVRTLKVIKSAVGDDVRAVEIFDYSNTPTVTLDPFTELMWDAFEEDGGISVFVFGRLVPTTIEVGDVVEYELDQSGTWINSGTTWGPPADFIVPGPLPPIVDVRIRYINNGQPSPASNVVNVDTFGGGGPEG